jgi:hypothetical protein
METPGVRAIVGRQLQQLRQAVHRWPVAGALACDKQTCLGGGAGNVEQELAQWDGRDQSRESNAENLKRELAQIEAEEAAKKKVRASPAGPPPTPLWLGQCW